MIKRLHFFIALCLLAFALTISCDNAKKEAPQAEVTMNPQAIILFFLDSLQHTDLTKIVSINNQTDTFKIAHADWIKEMDFLEALNTNKPAYKGTLMLDTTRNLDTLVYHLTCRDKKLNLQEAYISYYRNQLLHMTVKSSNSNFLYNNAKEIYFNPLKGYCIKGCQQLDVISKHEVAYSILVNKTI